MKQKNFRINELGISLLRYDNSNYPAQLKELTDHNAFIYKGNINLINYEQIAIVVPEKQVPTALTLLNISQQLCQFVISSGLADGIDATAHRQCLDYTNKQ